MNCYSHNRLTDSVIWSLDVTANTYAKKKERKDQAINFVISVPLPAYVPTQGVQHSKTDLREISYLGYVVKFVDKFRFYLKLDKSWMHFKCKTAHVHISPCIVFITETDWVLCQLQAECKSRRSRDTDYDRLQVRWQGRRELKMGVVWSVERHIADTRTVSALLEYGDEMNNGSATGKSVRLCWHILTYIR